MFRRLANWWKSLFSKKAKVPTTVQLVVENNSQYSLALRYLFLQGKASALDILYWDTLKFVREALVPDLAPLLSKKFTLDDFREVSSGDLDLDWFVDDLKPNTESFVLQNSDKINLMKIELVRLVKELNSILDNPYGWLVPPTDIENVNPRKREIFESILEQANSLAYLTHANIVSTSSEKGNRLHIKWEFSRV